MFAAAERLFSCVFNLVPFFNVGCSFFLLKNADFILGTTLPDQAKHHLPVRLKMSIIYWVVVRKNSAAVKFTPTFK